MLTTDLTPEQAEAVRVTSAMRRGQSLKIDACAGSGKTSTLAAIARANPDKYFLYLAFNRAIVEEAKTKFPRNTTILTTHSLAWRIMRQKIKNFTVGKNALKIWDLKPLFPRKPTERDTDYSDRLSTILAQYRRFLQSDLPRPDNPAVIQILEAISRGILPVTHDWYLKQYQLLPPTQRKLDKFDFILLDEAQDTNAVTLDIVNSSGCTRVLTGDTHQSIYSFRGSFNALGKTTTDFTLQLSTSFRSNQKILDKANFFVRNLSLFNSKPMSSGSKPSDIRTEAIITRTNSKMIEVLDQYAIMINHLKIMKTPDEIFKPVYNIIKLDTGQKDFDFDFKFLRNFSCVEELEKDPLYLTDPELVTAINMYKQYGPAKLKELKNLACRAYHTTHNAEQLVTVTNSHCSKGLEWDKVTLCDDFFNLFDIIDPPERKTNKKSNELNLQDELCVYYVAVTRARSELSDRTTNDRDYQEQRQLSPDADERLSQERAKILQHETDLTRQTRIN